MENVTKHPNCADCVHGNNLDKTYLFCYAAYSNKKPVIKRMPMSRWPMKYVNGDVFECDSYQRGEKKSMKKLCKERKITQIATAQDSDDGTVLLALSEDGEIFGCIWNIHGIGEWQQFPALPERVLIEETADEVQP